MVDLWTDELEATLAEPPLEQSCRLGLWGLAFWLLLSFSIACGKEIGDGHIAEDLGLGDGPGSGFDGLAQLSSAIIDGSMASSSEFPAVGVILYTTRGQDAQSAAIGSMICSGTLIAPDVVLAAGHCQEPELARPDVHVDYYFSLSSDVSSFGPHVQTLPEDAVRVNAFEVHPSYSPGQASSGVGKTDDLALLYLSQPFSVAPVPLMQPAQARTALQAGNQMTIVGYGRSQHLFFSAGNDGVKQQGISTLEKLGAFEMQIGRGPTDAFKCFGDSGGPTLFTDADGRDWLAGVTSRGASYGNCRDGGIDTRIDPYVGWIEASLAAACGSGARVACSH